MRCLIQVLFLNRNKMRKIDFVSAAIISRDVYSCLYPRSREFGSMKDSGEGGGGAPLVRFFINQGPVVQSIVSLTSSLRDQLAKCFTTL